MCRTFGDVEAKEESLLGNPKVVIADPDICFFKVDKMRHDFVLLGCDGIFDKLDDKDCVHTVWQNAINRHNYETSCKLFNANVNKQDLGYNHQLCGAAVDAVLKSTAIRRSADNITVVMVAFDSFFNLVRKSQGDISRFEYKQIELQQIDLIQPPLKPDSAAKPQQNEILIDDA